MTYAYREIQLSTKLSTRVLDTGGDGPVAILIHGLAASIEIWERIIPKACENLSCDCI